MHRNASDYIERGNYNAAITTCKQALLIAPAISAFTKQLANACYLSGNFIEAEKSLNTLKTKDCDTQYYRLLAASQAAQMKFKLAEKTIQTGIDRFPLSGLLYHEKGIIYKLALNDEEAVDSWLAGMEKDPGYAPNYYEAALSSLKPDMAIWGLISGEIYLVMNHDTSEDTTLKIRMFGGYKTLFEDIANSSSLKVVMPGGKKWQAEFQDAVLSTYAMLTPVISDGITAENLVMLRTRFLMDWQDGYSDKYPFPLFSYLEEMTASGHFEIYNEWLFGAAENVEQFDAWNKFHDGDIARFEEWKALNQFVPVIFPFTDIRKKKKQ